MLGFKAGNQPTILGFFFGLSALLILVGSLILPFLFNLGVVSFTWLTASAPEAVALAATWDWSSPDLFEQPDMAIKIKAKPVGIKKVLIISLQL